MPLTDVKIRQAKATDKALKLADSAGLYLEVKPNGSKLSLPLSHCRRSGLLPWLRRYGQGDRSIVPWRS